MPRDLGAAAEDAGQAQQQRRGPAAFMADPIEPADQRRQHMDILQQAERPDVVVPTIAGQALAMGTVEQQAGMRHIRHQRQRRQRLQARPRGAGQDHRHRQSRRLPRCLVAGGHQPPGGAVASGDEILLSMQDQPLQAGLQIRRAHAALLGHAQRAETFRRRRPERAQGRLVAGEEGQARTRRQSSAEHRPLQGAKTVGARQGGGVPVFQGAFGGQAVERAEQALPGHGGLQCGMCRNRHPAEGASVEQRRVTSGDNVIQASRPCHRGDTAPS